MFHIVLFQPEIPPNTGNIIRLCANTGAGLHLIHPLGFTLEDKQLRRAGLDYDEYARVSEYPSLADFATQVRPTTLYAASTKGTVNYATINYRPGDAILFGPETRGLPADVLSTFDPAHILRIPMQKTSRSLNLSNAVSVVLYEALRQNHFVFADV
jgi:tRNA (cytidine/uridine-2'-O-)-methyltransferase